jgi:hypothetical protein
MTVGLIKEEEEDVGVCICNMVKLVIAIVHVRLV